MRVIGGIYRSRVLSAPKGSATRPTSDRLRETLFNILAPRIEGAVFADLYAGSGAVGIEAVSRGANLVYLAERAAPAVAAIRKNLAALGVASGVGVEARGAAAFLERLAEALAAGRAADRMLDVVFLDPPWEEAPEYGTTFGLLGGKLGRRILAPGAVVVAEHAAKLPLPTTAGDLVQTRTLKQGDAALSFYRRSDE